MCYNSKYIKKSLIPLFKTQRSDYQERNTSVKSSAQQRLNKKRRSFYKKPGSASHLSVRTGPDPPAYSERSDPAGDPLGQDDRRHPFPSPRRHLYDTHPCRNDLEYPFPRDSGAQSRPARYGSRESCATQFRSILPFSSPAASSDLSRHTESSAGSST